MSINEIENYIGKSLADFTLSDVEKLASDEKILLELTNPDTGLEIAERILETNSNDDVKAEFTPLKYHHLLYNSQVKLSQMFAQYESDRDTEALVSDLKDFLESATPLGKLSCYLVILNSFNDFDIKEYEEDLKNTVKESEEILFSLDILKSFPVVCDLIDMLYSIQQLYFEKYQVDVIGEDAEKMNAFIKKIDEFTQPIYDEMQKEISEELPEEAQPEDIGLIDVTKFNNEKEN